VVVGLGRGGRGGGSSTCGTFFNGLNGAAISHSFRGKPTSEGLQEGAPQHPSKLARPCALIQTELPNDLPAGPAELYPDRKSEDVRARKIEVKDRGQALFVRRILKILLSQSHSREAVLL